MSDLENWVLHGDEMRRPLLVHPKFAESNKIVIVGAGLSGLCSAYRIAKKRPDLHIIIHEKSDKTGGVIATWKQDEWVCDVAVNATRAHPAFWRLVEDLGLESKFTVSNPDAKSRWVLLKGQRHKLSWKTLFKIGPLRLMNSIRKSRKGGLSVSEVIPHKPIADAMCLGIVNDTSENVDADFLFPSLTRFGASPPIKNSRLKKLISESYPLFTPKKGVIASIDGGMGELVEVLRNQISGLSNVKIVLGKEAESVQSVSEHYDVPLTSVLWTGPNPDNDQGYSEISVFAVGYSNQQVEHIEVGYGTLIPDKEVPISGILHESDVHQSKRSPEGHRLFRLMVPKSRWKGDEDSIRTSAEQLLAKDPVMFEKIGERRIPSYIPGHLSKVAQIKPECSYAGWYYSGVSITHVADQAERIAELF